MPDALLVWTVSLNDSVLFSCHEGDKNCLGYEFDVRKLNLLETDTLFINKSGCSSESLNKIMLIDPETKKDHAFWPFDKIQRRERDFKEFIPSVVFEYVRRMNRNMDLYLSNGGSYYFHLMRIKVK